MQTSNNTSSINRNRQIGLESSLVTAPNIKPIFAAQSSSEVNTTYIPNSFLGLLSEQHPVIHTWLLLSSLSLLFLSGLFFILP